MPGLLGNNPYRHPVFGIGAGIAVLHKQFFTLRISLQPVHKSVEFLGAEGPVVNTPPYFILGGFFFDNKFIRRRSCGVLAGINYYRTSFGEFSFVAENDLFVKRRFRKIPIYFIQVIETVIGKFIIRCKFFCDLACGRIEF